MACGSLLLSVFFTFEKLGDQSAITELIAV